ncbi:MAG: hypothetical protein LBE25_01760 [Arthrobacter sp.]|nr:hypothetical protein [Arthrobacter sp.]
MPEFDLLSALQHAAAAPSAPASTAAGRTPCSRKACTAPAAWALLWNNPKIHAPERRKTWLACDEHRAWLSDYLETRGFLREVTPFHDGPREG